MSYTYWYAIIQAPESLVAPAGWGVGLRGSVLRLAPAGDLAAVVSDWPQASINRSSEAVEAELVWQHEHVIERIMADHTVLPVRFGTVLAGDDRVQSVLDARQALLLADLARVAGCVELGVRVLWEPPAAQAQAVSPDSSATPGVQYLQRRAAEEQARQFTRSRGETLANELVHSLRAAAVDARQSVLQTERMLLAASFLVRRTEIDAFLAAVERLRGQHHQLAFLCSGPWPAYHFVSA